MAKRGAGPALYEMIQSRLSSRPAVVEPVKPAPPPQRAVSAPPPPPPSPPMETGDALAWLSPGRVVRLPVGYVLLGAAGVVVLLILMYLAGYMRGERLARAEAEQIVAQRLRPDEPGRTVSDPLLAGSGAAKPTSLGGPGAAPRTDTREPRTRTEPPRTTTGDGDPRQSGLNYFVLMHASQSGTAKFVEFCRAEGLDAWSVRADNKGSFAVIALPGYAAGQRGSPEIKKLEQRLGDAMAKWRTQTKEKLAYYPDKYESPKTRTSQP